MSHQAIGDYRRGVPGKRRVEKKYINILELITENLGEGPERYLED